MWQGVVVSLTFTVPFRRLQHGPWLPRDNNYHFPFLSLSHFSILSKILLNLSYSTFLGTMPFIKTLSLWIMQLTYIGITSHDLTAIGVGSFAQVTCTFLILNSSSR